MPEHSAPGAHRTKRAPVQRGALTVRAGKVPPVSSTNRGGQRSEADFYPTPAWCVRRLIEAAALPGGHWLEPAAGRGDIIRAVDEVRSDVTWTAVELRAECRGVLTAATGSASRVHIRDFTKLSRSEVGSLDVVITNPPYSIAMEMLEHALTLSAARVVMLLRLNFLASGARAPFMRRHAPDVYVLPNRPSFSGRGTDSIEYAWFVWHPGRRRRHGRVEVLPVTPASERAARSD